MMEPKSSEETEQEASLALYKSQLSQVDQAIQAAGVSEDLTSLKSDLEELIKLTEDNLLEIKKAKLLKLLGPPAADEDEDDDKAEVSGLSSHEAGNVDDEYAAFQMAIAESSNSIPTEENKSDVRSDLNDGLAVNSRQGGTSAYSEYQPRHGDNDDDVEENDEDDDSFAQARSSLLELVGTKCRAPFSQEWGDHHYGNAMILSVDPPGDTETLEDCVVHVIFINPIHQSMVPCQYFMDDKCRFSAQDCRSSHGYPVKVSHLHPYLEPEYSKLTEGCRCLAKREEDRVWSQGVVVDVCSDSELRVRFEATKDEDLVLVEHVIPLDNDGDDTSTDSDSSDDESSNPHRRKKTALDSDDDEDEMPVYLYKPLQTTVKLGAWETHTKGIGSKLMVKMGYIPGQGLGRNGEGRAEPVPILLLPQGKSLDKIMELKEMAGNADLFNAMKKMERRQKAMEKQDAHRDNKQRKGPTNWGVFGFLNQHLDLGKGGRSHGPSSADPQSSTLSSSPSSSSTSLPSSSSSSTVVAQAKQSSEKDLSKRSDKEVNVQIFKTAEAIRGVERNLIQLRRQLARNENRDRKMTDNIRQKIEQEESSLRKLKNSSQTLENHKERRKDHKKLTIF